MIDPEAPSRRITADGDAAQRPPVQRMNTKTRYAVADFIEEERKEAERDKRERMEAPVPSVSLWTSHHARLKTHAIGIASTLVVSAFFVILLLLFL